MPRRPATVDTSALTSLLWTMEISRLNLTTEFNGFARHSSRRSRKNRITLPTRASGRLSAKRKRRKDSSTTPSMPQRDLLRLPYTPKVFAQKRLLSSLQSRGDHAQG